MEGCTGPDGTNQRIDPRMRGRVWRKGDKYGLPMRAMQLIANAAIYRHTIPKVAMFL
jgi:hypothetical protein